MLQIKSDFSIQRLLRDALIEFFHNAMSLVEDCETVKQQMSRVYTLLVAATTALFKAAEQTQKSDLTDPIFQLDSQRDILWTALEHAVLAQTKSIDETVRQAAISMQNTLKSLKVNTNAQYLRESGAMDTVLSVLLGQKLETVTATGLLPLVQQLNDVNESMHRLIEERNTENSAKPTGAFETARRAAEDAYREFVRFVNAYWVINVAENNLTNEDLQNFMVQLNTLIDQYIRTQKLGNGTGSGSNTGSESEGEGGAEGGEQQPGETTPGEGEQGPGEGEQEQETPTKYTATFVANGATVATQEYEAGEVISAPAAPSGYEWEDYGSVEIQWGYTKPCVFPVL